MADPSKIAPLIDTWRAIEKCHQALSELYGLAERQTTGREDSPKAQEQADIARSAQLIAETLEGQMGFCLGMN